MTADIRVKIYRDTMEYIARSLPRAVVHDYVDDDDLLSFIKRHSFYSVISTIEISYRTSVLLKGLDLIQILIGKRGDLTETCDIIIDPLVIKSDQYLVGTKYLLRSVVDHGSIDDIVNLLQMDREQILEELYHNEAENELLEIVNLFRKLDWDSNFFGINIGYISCLRLTPNIENHVKDFVRKENIDMIEYLCNCHDRKSVITAEKNGYSFVDIRLTFEQFLREKKVVTVPQGYFIRKASHQDIDMLRKIARTIYKLSRYYYDSNFDPTKVSEFYSNWVEKAVLGTFDDYAYVLCQEQEPAGFCSVKEVASNVAKIGLFGMAPTYSGKGLAQYFLDLILQELKEKGFSYVEVVTQGRNYGAQRLYQRSGFITRSTELWYHKWFH